MFTCTKDAKVNQGVHISFLFPMNILSNKVKKSILQKTIFINSRLIYKICEQWFFKDIWYCRKLKKKCGHLDLLFRRIAKVGRKVGVKAATFSYGFTSLINVRPTFLMKQVGWGRGQTIYGDFCNSFSFDGFPIYLWAKRLSRFKGVRMNWTILP